MVLWTSGEFVSVYTVARCCYTHTRSVVVNFIITVVVDMMACRLALAVSLSFFVVVAVSYVLFCLV